MEGKGLPDRIKKAAVSEIKKYGFRRFTMDDLAARLKVSKKTIYKSFASKQELITAILSDEFEQEAARIATIVAKDEHWFDRLNELVDLCAEGRFSPALLEEANLFFPEQAKLIENRYSIIKQQYTFLLQEGLSKGHIQPDIHLDLLVIIMDELINQNCSRIIEQSKGISLVQRLEEIKKILFFGVIRREW
ncbi:MAG: TetR/AcrR family transcriptional regulator [Syntrophomonadaceae bacterium]|nr:TetR/AcrR family transcriptional regulator [Syntrophomonadaceae bacterium]